MIDFHFGEEAARGIANHINVSFFIDGVCGAVCCGPLLEERKWQNRYLSSRIFDLSEMFWLPTVFFSSFVTRSPLLLQVAKAFLLQLIQRSHIYSRISSSKRADTLQHSPTSLNLSRGTDIFSVSCSTNTWRKVNKIVKHDSAYFPTVFMCV